MKNSDIETLIRSMFADGDSADNIAKEFADVLNKVEADRNGTVERDKYLDDLHTNVCRGVAKLSSIDAATVTNVATIAIANKEPKMRRADLEEIHTSLGELINILDAFIEGDDKRVMELVMKAKPKNLDVDAKITNFLRSIGLS